MSKPYEKEGILTIPMLLFGTHLLKNNQLLIYI